MLIHLLPMLSLLRTFIITASDHCAIAVLHLIAMRQTRRRAGQSGTRSRSCACGGHCGLVTPILGARVRRLLRFLKLQQLSQLRPRRAWRRAKDCGQRIQLSALHRAAADEGEPFLEGGCDLQQQRDRHEAAGSWTDG